MLQEWAKNWQMQFNVQKVMAVHTHARTHARTHKVHDTERDLTAIMSADLKAGSHCSEA